VIPLHATTLATRSPSFRPVAKHVIQCKQAKRDDRTDSDSAARAGGFVDGALAQRLRQRIETEMRELLTERHSFVVRRGGDLDGLPTRSCHGPSLHLTAHFRSTRVACKLRGDTVAVAGVVPRGREVNKWHD